jgi:hypothetical protein
MKKTIIIILLALCLFSAGNINTVSADVYSNDCGIITLADENGELWEFENIPMQDSYKITYFGDFIFICLR